MVPNGCRRVSHRTTSRVVRCATTQHPRPVRFRDRDIQRHIGVDPHLVAGHDLLPIGDDAVDSVDIAVGGGVSRKS